MPNTARAATVRIWKASRRGASDARTAACRHRRTSDMLGFSNTLEEEEIRASLAYIKSTWPEAQRAHQARVTLSKK